MNTQEPVFFTPEQEAARERGYLNGLIERYEAGLSLHPSEKREARREIKARKAFAAQRATVES